MKKKLLFALIFFFFTFINCHSQFSKTHYIPPLSAASVLTTEDQYLYISTPSINPINFRIIELGGAIIPGTVSRDVPYVHYVGFGNNTQLIIDGTGVNSNYTNKGYIIEADDMVYVSARVTAGNGNQAGELVSKGKAALGTRYRIGAFTNESAPSYGQVHYSFVTVLATENNTTVNISGIKSGAQLINSSTGSIPFSIVLNSGESYVMAVQGPLSVNRDALIGSLVTSDKPIALNCGSFGGTNGEMGNLDLGFDQIVSAERTGKDFIFIKSTGLDNVERILLVADTNNTQVYLDGASTPSYTLNAGEYIALNGAQYNANGNLYIRTSENIFAYQSIGDDGLSSQANQEMFFVPPLSCQTPHVIDNIPFIDFVGSRQFTGRVTIVTEAGAALNFIVDGINYPLAALPAIVDGPTNVVGNSNYETYVITGLTGNVSVYSNGELYLAAYGSSDAATFGGYYSGFTFKPEVTFGQLNIAQASCIPNSFLAVNTLSPFDSFQWYFNGNPIPSATGSSYTPTAPGNYYVSAANTSCTPAINLTSDIIPVSDCPKDTDNDGVNNNIDLDLDNDGITNCTESYGDQNVDLTNPAVGSVNIGSYSNSFIGTIATTGTGTPSTTPMTGDATGNFVTEAAAAKGDTVSYTATFNNPISLAVEYATTAQPTDYFSAATEIRISCPVNQTLTILNPNNQLLIDTNYDGIFETGVAQFSSFEIRFRLDGSSSLVPGTGAFSIRGNSIRAITITNINLDDINTSRATFRLMATCVPIDTDNDGIGDQYDYDSDNDAIPDFVESQGQNIVALSNNDANGDGIDDIFGNGITPADSDNDGHPNYLDLDADNDGIFDIMESGSPGNGANTTGIITGNVGANGLANNLETFPDSGIINYTIADTDADGTLNYIALDSDADTCKDVTEAGFTDANNDGILDGTNPVVVNANGTIVSASGYGVPNANYTIAAPISITTQPQNFTSCELQPATFTVVAPAVTSYQWQVSTDNGMTWATISNGPIYSNTTTAAMTILSVAPSMSGYQYRVFLNRTGNSCGLYSAACLLTTYALPVVTTPISLKQCDDNTDGISAFNLTQKNDVISANYLNETFTYYTTQAAANTEDSTLLIANPIAYVSGNTAVYARVENGNGCFRVVRIDLIVSVTQIPPSFVIPNQYKCDDYLDAVNDDRDGISTFDFTNITNSLLAIPLNNVSIKYYKSLADFLAETDAAGNSLAIANPANYRNIGYPNVQTIWVRVDSNVDNSCFGFKTFDLVVEALPFANPVNASNVIRHCDDNQDGSYGFDTSMIQTAVLNGQTGVTVKYFRANGTPLPSPLPNPFVVNGTETITIRVSNNTTQTGGQPCYDEETLQFIVDDLPEAFIVPANLTTTCDDEANSIDQNGLYDFDTSTFLSAIVGTQTGMNVHYYDQNNVLIPSPTPNQLPNPFTTGTQNVRAVVENPINTACYDEVILPFIVHPVPKIDQEETILICLPDTQATLDAGILDESPTSNYAFQWYYNNGILAGQINPTLVVSTPGTYSVTVTNGFGCSRTRVIEVIGSEIASIQSIDVSDLTDINSILITVNGSGDYQYSLDDIEGPYRDSNFFNNVPIGLHELFIRDKNGCGILGPIAVPVLGIPHYFTPNGDGFHDYWNVKGVSPLSPNAHSVVYIFDRYGKLLKQIQPAGAGWDGTYNGHQMPADDYWYTVQFVDGRLVKGHFSLKR